MKEITIDGIQYTCEIARDTAIEMLDESQAIVYKSLLIGAILIAVIVIIIMVILLFSMRKQEKKIK